LVAAAARRGRQRRRSSKGGRRRLLVGLAVLSLVAAGIAGVAIVGAAVGPKIIRSRCDLSSLRQINIGSNSFVTASDNSLLGTIPAKKNRQQLTLAQMSPWLPKATVAIEDRRVLQHGAADSKAVVPAPVQGIQHGRTRPGA